MAGHSELSKAEEQIATRRRAEDDSPAQHGAEASYLTTLMRHANLRGRGSNGTRAQVLLNEQRMHGNRAVQRALSTRGVEQIAVQREEYSPSIPPFLMGPLTMGWDYLLHSAGQSDPNRGQPTVSEMVQNHIARAQGARAFQEEKNDREIDGAQRAITGLPPDWFTWGEDPPGALEQPQYDYVSPALNPWELQELQTENEYLQAGRH